MMGFPKGELYAGTPAQKQKLESQFLRKATYMHTHNIPTWNGEFGPVYANPLLDRDHEAINRARYAVLAQQLRIYDRYTCHWSIWLYKDIGVQGMLYASPASPYMKAVAPFLARKRALQTDAWGTYPSAESEAVIKPLVKWIDRVAPTSSEQYPTSWATERQVMRVVNQMWIAGCLEEEFAGLFAGMGLRELEECAKSFRFEECVQREELNRELEEHAHLREQEAGNAVLGEKMSRASLEDVVLERE
jgi:hypothetical protein